jgi:hypothetical protein
MAGFFFSNFVIKTSEFFNSTFSGSAVIQLFLKMLNFIKIIRLKFKEIYKGGKNTKFGENS